jgi:hypothetical protein
VPTSIPMPPPALQAERAERAGRRRCERATALILVPTMLLVLFALGGIALDLTALHTAQRHVHRVVSAAADDAAGMLDAREVQRSGAVRIDPEAARRVAAAHVTDESLPGELVAPVQVDVVDGGTAIAVRAQVRLRHVMLRAVPGAGDDAIVTVTARARLAP